MGWLAERTQWRGNPAALWPEAKSILMLAEVYTTEEEPLGNLTKPDIANISVYARQKDYRDLVKNA